MRKMLDKKEIEKIIDEHGGEPEAYLKSASVDGNTLTLTNKDNTTVAFTPEEVEIDNRTIVENAQGKLETAVGGYSVQSPAEDYVDNENNNGFQSTSEPLFDYVGGCGALVEAMGIKEMVTQNHFTEGNLYTVIVKVNGTTVWERDTNVAWNNAGSNPADKTALLIHAAVNFPRISVNTSTGSVDQFRIKMYVDSTSAMTFEETDVVTLYIHGPGLTLFSPIDGRFVPVDGTSITLNNQNKLQGFSGNYNDLSNKPTIPAAQVQSDWSQSDNTQVDFIKNKPTIPDAVSGVNDGTNWTSLTIGSDTYGIGGGSAPANMVTTDTAQTISGVKTFSNDIALSGNVGINIPNASYHGIYNKQGTGYDEAKITLSSSSGGGSVNFAIVNGYSASNRAQVSLNATSSAAHLTPISGTVDLGTSTYPWNNLYVGNTIQIGSTTLSEAQLQALLALLNQ